MVDLNRVLVELSYNLRLSKPVSVEVTVSKTEFLIIRGEIVQHWYNSPYIYNSPMRIPHDVIEYSCNYGSIKIIINNGK